MLRNQLIATAQIPGMDGKLELHQRGERFSIWVTGHRNLELMNNSAHGSEEALAELTCTKVVRRKDPKVLVGGMGMGYTLAAALKHLGDNAKVVLAELIPEVVEWNRTYLGDFAGHPLEDKRVEVKIGDVGRLLRAAESEYDVIMLDVDNGPQGLTTDNNNWLYSVQGLKVAKHALKDKGIFAVWSVSDEPKFTDRLGKVGFKVTREKVRTHGHKGSHHVIWVAEKK